jgi:hypothetical protein
MVDYMLFVDEAPIRDPIKGVSSFAMTFSQRGPRDTRGRSLRDFDLQKRLFRYPLSYMIYSDIFEAMPAVARNRVYQRLHDVCPARIRIRSLISSLPLIVKRSPKFSTTRSLMQYRSTRGLLARGRVAVLTSTPVFPSYCCVNAFAISGVYLAD